MANNFQWIGIIVVVTWIMATSLAPSPIARLTSPWVNFCIRVTTSAFWLGLTRQHITVLQLKYCWCLSRMWETFFLPESTSFLDHLIPSWAKRSLASGSSKTNPIVFPSIMTAFSLSFPNVPAFSSRSISLLRIPLAVATSPLILKIISKLKWRRFCPLDEGLHPGGDHPAALADVDGGLLLVSGQHPHVDLRSQQVGNCVRNPGNSIF